MWWSECAPRRGGDSAEHAGGGGREAFVSPSVRPGRRFLLTGWVQLSEEVERAPEALIGGEQGAG